MSVASEYSNTELCTASLSILNGILANDDVCAAWLSGSLIEQLGNPSSDVDIFVAVKGSLDNVTLTRRDTDHGVLALIQHNIRYDIEYWGDQNISRLAAKLDRLPVDDPSQNNLHFLEYWETEFIHRLFVGLPLINKDNFIKLRARFNKKRFTRFLLDTAVKRADDAFDDAVGMFCAGQMRMAALRALEAIEFSTDAFLHAHGVTNDKAKFRLRKLDMLSQIFPFAGVILERLWVFESQIPSDEHGLKLYTEEVLRYSSELVERAQNHIRDHMNMYDDAP